MDKAEFNFLICNFCGGQMCIKEVSPKLGLGKNVTVCESCNKNEFGEVVKV